MTYMPLAFYPMPLYAAPPHNVSNASAPMSELWQRLRQARKYADLTQADLAKACGVTRGAVALWEAAEIEHRTKPTTDHLVQISKKTRVPLEWLLNDAASTEALWKLTGEFGDNEPSPAPAPAAVLEPDVLPDLRQGDQLFVFAKTPAQISDKLAVLAAEPETTRKHLILVGVDAAVHAVYTPADALSAVVQAMNKNP
jgi:transcriptional regulator with XRE-family HTH domain